MHPNRKMNKNSENMEADGVVLRETTANYCICEIRQLNVGEYKLDVFEEK